ILLVASLGGPTAARGRVLLTRDAALAQVFGADAKIESRSSYLTPDQVTTVERAAQARLASPRIVTYRATRGDSLLGTAYLDTHLVRTMNETILIAVSRSGRVAAVEVLAFNEPEDYLPPRRWLEKFDDRALSKDLRPGEAVPNLGGATLTARAVAAAVRRTLALHRTIEAGGTR
ncbi:MAG: FMN-binding protein, partial [Candidatus Eiseniibacteriota bacterium]